MNRARPFFWTKSKRDINLICLQYTHADQQLISNCINSPSRNTFQQPKREEIRNHLPQNVWQTVFQVDHFIVSLTAESQRMWCLEGEIGQDNVHWCGPTIGDPFCASHQGCDEKREREEERARQKRGPPAEEFVSGGQMCTSTCMLPTHSLTQPRPSDSPAFFFSFLFLFSSRLLPC